MESRSIISHLATHLFFALLFLYTCFNSSRLVSCFRGPKRCVKHGLPKCFNFYKKNILYLIKWVFKNSKMYKYILWTLQIRLEFSIHHVDKFKDILLYILHWNCSVTHFFNFQEIREIWIQKIYSGSSIFSSSLSISHKL